MGDTAAKTKEEMEAEISQAMRARISDFKKQAETLTLEGVRRALETDLHLEKFSLDEYKKFIKQHLNECFAEADDETASKTPEKATEEVMQPEQEKVSRQHGDLQPSEIDPTDSVSDLSEDMIRGAMKKRAAHIRANIEKLSLAQVRRLLEGDLKLETKTLDAYKGFISNELDDILASAEEAVEEAANGVDKKQKKDSKSKEVKKKTVPSKSSSRVSESSTGSDDAPSDDEETKEERRPKKRPSKDTEASTKPSKKQKKSTEGSKKKKLVDLESDKSSDDEGGNSSESSRSRSSADERVIKKKTEKPSQVYGKQVEHLKSIMKSCGMGITPAVYKKAKQAPENKREAVLIKELEDILRKEGLSTNPSEKEIKAVKKRKATAKELEGIDTSNIVASSRRRAASSYIPLPEPKIDVESDDEVENEDEEDEEEDEDDGGESSDVSGQDAEDESD